jgi:protein-tyrosine-phosphatase
MELAASFSGHEGEGLRRLAVEAAKRVVRMEAAESRVSIPAARRAARRQLVERLRALQAEARDCPDGATKAAMAQAREALRLFDTGG